MSTRYLHFTRYVLFLAIIGTIVSLAFTSTPANAHNVTARTCAQIDARYHRCVSWAPRHHLSHLCARGVYVARKRTTVKHRSASLNQRKNIARVLRVGLDHGASLKVLVSSIQAITQESSANNLPYGHGSSVGILQLIDSHEPDGIGMDWRMQIVNSAGWYFRGAAKVSHSGRPGNISQRVQRSAHPGAYHAWESEAKTTVRRFLRPSPRCLGYRKA